MIMQHRLPTFQVQCLIDGVESYINVATRKRAVAIRKVAKRFKNQSVVIITAYIL